MISTGLASSRPIFHGAKISLSIPIFFYSTSFQRVSFKLTRFFTGKKYLYPYPYFPFEFIYVIEFGYNFGQSMSRNVILDSLIPTLFTCLLRNKHTHKREGKEIKLTFFISNVLFGRLMLLWFVWK